MKDKFPQEARTFETRLLFIKALFGDLFPQCDIMAHCIDHKLGRSFLAYSEELMKSELYLTGMDPIKALKTMGYR